MSDVHQLEEAIAALEAQRTVLGDAVVDAALASMREKLASLQPQQAARDQQRKLATILFADVSGFSALSGAMDAEDVTEVMNALWECLDRVITDYGGRIDKHIGDAVMALWGAEQANEDDPEQAVRAALAMQQALAAFRADRGVPVAMRIGVNTGPVLFGTVGTTHEFTAIGDTVNIASRLEQATSVGTVLIAHNTYRHVRGLFDVEPQAPLTVKGKPEPLQTYLVQAAKPRAFRMPTRGIEGIGTRTIGREAELLVLQNAYLDAVEGRKTCLVTVVGDPGVGKSRLLSEFESWVDHRPEQTLLFQGRAAPETLRRPAGLLRDLFCTRFSIRDADSSEVLRTKFLEGMTRHVTPTQAAVLGYLVGFDFASVPAVQAAVADPQFDEIATAYLTAYFQALTIEAQTLILLEDIHWTDDRSLDLLDAVLSGLPDQRLLVVCTARTVFCERRPDWGSGYAYGTRLDLKPLSSRNSRTLVNEILQRVDNLPDALRDMIVASAEGNPYYIEELIKMLLDEGVIVRDNGPDQHWYVHGERVGAVTVPPTLTGVLQARLDGLPREERETLQEASVVGRLFWDSAVAYLGGDHPVPPGDSSFEETLLALRARELVFRRERSAFTGAREYVFKHALLRDVTYESVLRRQRRNYHRRAAEWLVEVSGGRVEEYADLIAEHYAMAEDTTQEAEWRGRAGKHAAARYAHAEALRHIHRALDLIPQVDTISRYDLMLVREQVYALQGMRDAHARDLEVLEALAASLGVVPQAEVALRRSAYCQSTGAYQAAATAAQQALDTALATRLPRMEREALDHLTCIANIQGDYATAMGYARKALDVAREIGDRRDEAWATLNLGRVVESQGDYVDARSYFEQALDAAREIGDRRLECLVLGRLGSCAGDQGDQAGAWAYQKTALDVARAVGARRSEGFALGNLGVICVNQGDYAGAKEYLEAALDVARAIGELRLETHQLRCLGNVHWRLGNYAASQSYFGQSLDLARTIGDRWNEVHVLTALGGISRCQLDYTKARTYTEQAVEMARAISSRLGEGCALSSLGHVLAALGRTAEAAGVYQEALELGLELRFAHMAAECRAGLAAMLYAQGDQAGALTQVGEVLGYLETGNVNMMDDPMAVYLVCFKVLEAAGDDRAEPLLSRAHSELLGVANKLDLAARRMFLQEVPSNREIVAAWEGRHGE
jgi:class 3 adenylate cyclase/tetratricopeptide (TPR) repeat protein